MTAVPSDDDRTEALAEAVRAALAAGEPLEIRGGGTKRFYGESAAGEPLAVGGHRGVLSYEPSELVLTARAGTPLAEIERLLSEHGQMLACEPPHFGPGATLGGTVACGLSGPRRPWAGAVRDFVLGVRLIDGRAETGRYGGEVMKNVAGYDVSRLVTGALGTLGLLLDVSLKVLPAPERETTRVLELAADRAVELFNALAGRPVPLTAAAWEGGLARIRLGGSAAGVAAALAEVGGEDVPPAEAAAWWSGLREQRLAFFAGDAALWRLAVRPATPPLDLPGDWLLDWGGGQRWLRTAAPAETIRAAASGAGGHATAFRGAGPGVAVFHPLPDALMALHRRVKAALDPAGLFNPGRLYAGL